MITPWPPIIGYARVPWWTRLRDRVLTLLAWAALLYAVSPLWMALWLDIKVVLGFSDAHAIPALAYSWRIMRPFLGVSGLLSLWLVSFAIVRRHLYLTKWRVLNQPSALLRKDEIARSGLSPELAAQLQERRMSVVRFDAQGLVGHLDAD